MTNPTQITVEPGRPFVDIVREFDAPVGAVFRAHTDPDLFARWTGPGQLTMEILAFDAVTGGQWRYVSRDPAGGSYGFRGVFHTVETDALIIQTFEFDGAPGQVSMSVARFEATDRGTRITTHTVFPSIEARDGMVATGMEYGATESYTRLDDVLAAVRA
ncbi:SRPBCC family protein [Amnibacterium sp.]|uniref:SRPBCC family protein n=1 Tax=Amnibacterium sp. TaxID=1872496 RepID=UPI002628918F|nr:SRPBCC family protein [Amnibacterium sp.]MCU1472996.1 hypothetical protein [Amnibacterium sp.]